jgi:hypothetical protein
MGLIELLKMLKKRSETARELDRYDNLYWHLPIYAQEVKYRSIIKSLKSQGRTPHPLILEHYRKVEQWAGFFNAYRHLGLRLDDEYYAARKEAIDWIHSRGNGAMDMLKTWIDD